jgi:DNA polymerase IV
MMLSKAERLVLHIDVDAFFASVEQLLIPSLRSRPVIVGSGCIASCSYEARRFGLRAGMSLSEAKRRCPSVMILPGQQSIYHCMAEEIWRICRRYVLELETFLDEAYGDATGMERLHGAPECLGHRLRRQVLEETGLSVSVGLGANRMLAKIASTLAKPGGVKWIDPRRAMEVLATMPIEALPGAGPKTARRLRDLNVVSVADLRLLSREVLRAMFGRRGELLHDRCRGQDPDPLRPRAMPRTISRETTFHKPTSDRAYIRGMLFYLLERAMRSARKIDLLAGAVELTIRYDDWKHLATRRSLETPTSDEHEAFETVLALLEQLFQRRVALRHVGVVLSGFRASGSQAELFTPPKRVRGQQLTRAMDTIRDRWGHAALVTGESIELMGKLKQNDYGFVLRTPSLTK